MHLLPKWALLNPPSAIYDLESVTPLQQTARVYGAMNDMIREYNTFADQINKEISEFVGSSEEEIKNFKKSVEERIRSKFNDIDETFAKIKSDLVTYTNDYLASVPALPVVSVSDNDKFMKVINGAWQAVQLVDKTLSYSGMAADAAEVGFLRTRLNNLASLPDGSTSGDAELQDIRTGYNQILYPNAGEAVRGQSKQLANFMLAMAKMDSKLLDLSDATFVTGSYLKEDGTVEEHDSLKYTQDYIDIEADWESFTMYKRIAKLHNGEEDIIGESNVVFYTSDGIAGGVKIENITRDGDLTTYKIPAWARRARFNFGVTNPIDVVRVNKFKNGKVGEYTGTFTEVKQELFPDITLHAGKKYLIRNESASGGITAFIIHGSSHYISLQKDEPDRYFTPKTTGKLEVYCANSTGIGEVKISVYLADEETKLIEKPPKVYTVGGHAAIYDYTSLTKCLLDLKDDKTPKIIYINEGDYDIYQEYKDAGVPAYTGDSPTYDYFDYCVWIPENTHIIGRGVVRLMWMPDPANVPLTYNESATISPVNCAGTMTLENVEIHCKNGRYCIHDDPLGKGEFTNAIKKYINVRCYKYANDEGFGFKPTIGFGVDRSMRYEFHNCLFKNELYYPAFYMHDRKTVNSNNLTEKMGSNIVATNCVMDTNGTISVKFGNSSSAAHIRVDFNSCWFGGKININNESNTETTTYPNSWDLKLCLCNDVQINIADTENKYPPAVYGYTGG